jgi:hypothetical protein
LCVYFSGLRKGERNCQRKTAQNEQTADFHSQQLWTHLFILPDHRWQNSLLGTGSNADEFVAAAFRPAVNPSAESKRDYLP